MFENRPRTYRPPFLVSETSGCRDPSLKSRGIGSTPHSGFQFLVIPPDGTVDHFDRPGVYRIDFQGEGGGEGTYSGSPFVGMGSTVAGTKDE